MKSLALVLVCVVAACGANNAAPCQTNDQCPDVAAPFCVDGECHACSGTMGCDIDHPRCSPDTLTCGACSNDLDCGGYPMDPHCAPDGACVGCVDATQCPASAPACDTHLHQCRGCEIDDECASNVCDVATGLCVDAAAVVYASSTGPPTRPPAR
jgi:hypothetical protein